MCTHFSLERIFRTFSPTKPSRRHAVTNFRSCAITRWRLFTQFVWVGKVKIVSETNKGEGEEGWMVRSAWGERGLGDFCLSGMPSVVGVPGLGWYVSEDIWNADN